MNGDADAPDAVTARLPSGAPVKVEVAGLDTSDGMTSVGLRDLDLDSALDAVRRRHGRYTDPNTGVTADQIREALQRLDIDDVLERNQGALQ